MEMEKVLTLSSPALPKYQLDKLISIVIQEEGNERMIEWSLNDNGELDIYLGN